MKMSKGSKMLAAVVVVCMALSQVAPVSFAGQPSQLIRDPQRVAQKSVTAVSDVVLPPRPTGGGKTYNGTLDFLKGTPASVLTPRNSMYHAPDKTPHVKSVPVGVVPVTGPKGVEPQVE